jgi:hypothetical protein
MTLRVLSAAAVATYLGSTSIRRSRRPAEPANGRRTKRCLSNATPTRTSRSLVRAKLTRFALLGF